MSSSTFVPTLPTIPYVFLIISVTLITNIAFATIRTYSYMHYNVLRRLYETCLSIFELAAMNNYFKGYFEGVRVNLK